jgi:tetratricopeptide (TPR) repeat protein
LALSARISSEEELEPSQITLTEQDIREQAARVLAMIEQDESKRLKPEGKAYKRVTTPARFRYRWAVASLVFVGVVGFAVSLFVINQPAPEQVAMNAIAEATNKQRRVRLRVSGGFAHSPYVVTRGAEAEDDTQFRRAIIKLKPAEQQGSPAEQRLVLARAYLSQDLPGDASRARTILEEIIASGVESAEVLNDLGVALFQLEDYPAAIASFSRALNKKADFEEALFNRALARQYAKEKEGASRDWEQFLHLTADPKWKAEAEEHLNLLKSSADQPTGR